jgi:hypothetical protein
MFQSFKRVGLLRGQSGTVALAEPDSLRLVGPAKGPYAWVLPSTASLQG